MKQTTLVCLAVLVLLSTTSAEARWRWPWEHHGHRVHRSHVASPNNQDEPIHQNCKQINSAIRTLNPDNYEQSMRSSTKKQKEYIAECQVGRKP